MKEKSFPPWRRRMRRRLGRLLVELLRPSSMVRLVGPNSKPLERHEFEIVRSRYESRVL